MLASTACWFTPVNPATHSLSKPRLGRSLGRSPSMWSVRSSQTPPPAMPRFRLCSKWKQEVRSQAPPGLPHLVRSIGDQARGVSLGTRAIVGKSGNAFTFPECCCHGLRQEANLHSISSAGTGGTVWPSPACGRGWTAPGAFSSRCGPGEGHNNLDSDGLSHPRHQSLSVSPPAHACSKIAKSPGFHA
jgi:hypothetical protein